MHCLEWQAHFTGKQLKKCNIITLIMNEESKWIMRNKEPNEKLYQIEHRVEMAQYGSLKNNLWLLMFW